MKHNKAQQKNILFIHYGSQWLRGSEICLINLITSLSSKYKPILWTNNLPLFHALSKQGINSYHQDFSLLLGWQSPKFDMKATITLIKDTVALIKSHQIDAIHVNSGAPNQWAVIAALLTRTPIVTQLHCDYPLRDRASLLLHLCPQIITVSKAISKALLNEGFANENLKVIHNGVAEQKAANFSIHKTLKIAANEKVLISIGSLIARKGFDLLINAVKRLHTNGFKVHLVIIGEGESKVALESQIKRLKLENFIHLVGEQSNVASWLNGGCSLFVSAARSEAFGLVLVEAALAKLAIIAPNVGGISEVIEHNVSGVLYDSDKAEVQLPKAIEALLNNAHQTEYLAKNAYAKAQTHFSLTANTFAIEAIYHHLVTERSIVHQSRFKQILSLLALLRPAKAFIQITAKKFYRHLKESTQ